MMNANENLADKGGELISFLLQTGLIDIHEHFHGVEHEPAMYNPGSGKIDYCLETQGLKDCVRECGLLAFGEGVDSDHCSLFLDIDAVHLFRYSTPDLTHITLRILDIHIPHFVPKYGCILVDQFQVHHVYDWVSKLAQIQGKPLEADI